MEPDTNGDRLLRVEYDHSDPTLELAARAARTESYLDLLPNKTSMVVGPRSVEVSTFHGGGRDMVFAEVSPESAAAAKWWAQFIPETSPAERAKHEQFQTQLARRIEAMHPDESGSKQVSATNGVVDKVLEHAAASAGITGAEELFPRRNMVVQPGKVSLLGFQGSVSSVVFQASRPGAQGPGTVVVL